MQREIGLRGQTLLDGDEDTGSLAFAYHAHDVISPIDEANGPAAIQPQRICLVKVEGQQIELQHEN
jgi:hypothetical protein